MQSIDLFPEMAERVREIKDSIQRLTHTLSVLQEYQENVAKLAPDTVDQDAAKQVNDLLCWIQTSLKNSAVHNGGMYSELNTIKSTINSVESHVESAMNEYSQHINHIKARVAVASREAEVVLE